MDFTRDTSNTPKDPFKDKDFDSVFETLYEPLCKFCLKFVHQKDIAEDIVQEQFVYLWENRKRLYNQGSIKSYLYTSVRNKSISFLKSNYYKNKAEPLEVVSDINTNYFQPPDNWLESKELEKIIKNAINELPEKCRMVFTLKRFGELSNKEIADKLKISVKTVENQMTIALKRISKTVFSDPKFLTILFFKDLFL